MEGIRSLSELRLEDASGVPIAGTLHDRGHSSGVVLVHGIVGFRHMAEIETVAESLVDRHDVLSIDVRGHGDTGGRFSWGRDEWRQVAAAARFLKEPGRSVAVVGFSFGGYHAARAAANGAPIDRLVLVGAPVDLKVLDHFPLGPDFWRHAPAMLRRKRRIPRLDWRFPIRRNALSSDELARIAASTLVVHGARDFLISRRHAERYAREIHGARLHEIPNGLHAEYLMASHPEATLEAIGGFLL